MSDRIGELEAFIRVAEGGSFSAAARALGQSQPSLSKSVAALERRIGARLLVRTTRQVSLTEAGISYLAQAKRIIASLAEADASVRHGRDAVHGRLRLNTSALLATTLVLPTVNDFRLAHPAIEIELTMDDRRVDPVEESADLILRIGALGDSSLRQRRVGAATLGFFATPDYLAIHPAPADLRDLGRHEYIRLAGRWEDWRVPGGGEADAVIRPRSQLAVSNALLAREAMLLGAGIAVLPHFMLAADVATGRAIELLREIELPTMEITFLHPYGAEVPRKVTAFIEHAIGQWKPRLAAG